MLTERNTQLDCLVQLLQDRIGHANHTTRSIAVITGPVGSGKTALLQAFAKRVTDEGIRFLSATASRAERNVPFEVIRQIFRSNSRTAELDSRVWDTLDEGARTWILKEEGSEDVVSRVTVALSEALLELIGGKPLVVGVDDIQHADIPSLRCLAHLARQSADAPLLLVLTEAPRVVVRHPEPLSELLQPGRVHRLWLPMLSKNGVYTMLAAQLGAPLARRLASECLHLTGGSPVLVEALINDYQAVAPPRPNLVVGEAFREAVISCLYRCDPLVLKAVRVLAVTGEPITSSWLPHFIDLPNDPAHHPITHLTTAGLVSEGQLRNPAIAQAVLDGMTPEERTTLHRRVASLMHWAGSPSASVAKHLLKAGELSETWMVQSLVDAAEETLHGGGAEIALQYLHHAHRYCMDNCQRTIIRSLLARAEWLRNPHAAARHLPEVVSAIRAGHLTNRQAVVPIWFLLWQGEFAQAQELLQQLDQKPQNNDSSTTIDLVATKLWLSALYPGRTKFRPRDLLYSVRDRYLLMKVAERVHGIIALSAIIARGDCRAATDCERILRTESADATDLFSAIWMLVALIHSDRLQQAEEICLGLMRLPGYAEPTPVAMITALRAAIALRRGEPCQALSLADEALAKISPEGWGVLVGIPLAVRLRALTRMGQLDRAATCLRVPLPSSFFETPIALYYLHARGEYHLATGALRSALHDFQFCGRRMAGWQLDLSALIPWRTYAARACLSLGRRKQATRLIDEELEYLGSRHPRERGAALRVLAATLSPAERIPVLRESASLLEQCGDRLELAHCLADLGDTYRELNDHREARGAVRAARTLAEQCGVPLLLPSSASRLEPATRSPATASVVTGLSAAEMQVAELAAQGHTNREIASKLFVTISTIEQHLTRVYRKLNVKSRNDLPGRLRLHRPGAIPTAATPEADDDRHSPVA